MAQTRPQSSLWKEIKTPKCFPDIKTGFNSILPENPITLEMSKQYPGLITINMDFNIVTIRPLTNLFRSFLAVTRFDYGLNKTSLTIQNLDDFLLKLQDTQKLKGDFVDALREEKQFRLSMGASINGQAQLEQRVIELDRLIAMLQDNKPKLGI